MKDTVKKAITLAVTSIPTDVESALRDELFTESGIAAVQLETMLENVRLAREGGKPICQDTGLLSFYITAGKDSPHLKEFMDILEDAIIDLTGLAPEVISLLDEHQFLVLSLAGEKDPLTMVSKTLGFIGVQSQDGPHSFMAADRSDSRNVKLTVSGIIFSDTYGNAIFATPLNLPNEIASFLSTRAYRILPLSSS